MKYKVKRYIAVIISSVWLVICILILIISSVKVKYPSVTAGLIEVIWLMAMMVPPIICLMLSIFCAVKNHTGTKRIILWVVIAILISGFIKIYVVDGVSPVSSYTTDIKNYLSVDDDISSKSDVIKYVFPESIANDSTNVKYRYYRPEKEDFEIIVEYVIEKELFETEKNRCKKNYYDISDAISEDENEDIFEVDLGDNSYTAIIKFNNENFSVSYQLYHRK